MKSYVKTLTILLIAAVLWSCNDDDEYANFYYVATHIDSIAMPDTATLGHRIPVKTFTTLKEGCQQFQMHGYDIVGNERTVTTWVIEWDGVACGEESVIAPSFYFEPMAPGTYHFRFWTGQDPETEEDIFLTKDITVL